MSETLFDKIRIAFGWLLGALIHRKRLTLVEGGWLATCLCGWESATPSRRSDAERAWEDHTMGRRART